MLINGTPTVWTALREEEIVARINVLFAAHHATLHQTLLSATNKQVFFFIQRLDAFLRIDALSFIRFGSYRIHLV